MFEDRAMPSTRVSRLTSLLLCSSAIAFLPATHADEVTTVEQTIVTPGLTVPLSRTTVTRTERIENPAPADQVIERRTVIYPERTGGGTVTSSSSTSIETNTLEDGKPKYARRIHDLKTQLDNAVAHNWVTAAQPRNSIMRLRAFSEKKNPCAIMDF